MFGTVQMLYKCTHLLSSKIRYMPDNLNTTVNTVVVVVVSPFLVWCSFNYCCVMRCSRALEKYVQPLFSLTPALFGCRKLLSN